MRHVAQEVDPVVQPQGVHQTPHLVLLSAVPGDRQVEARVADVGQGAEVGEAVEKALATGAIEAAIREVEQLRTEPVAADGRPRKTPGKMRRAKPPNTQGRGPLLGGSRLGLAVASTDGGSVADSAADSDPTAQPTIVVEKRY